MMRGVGVTENRLQREWRGRWWRSPLCSSWNKSNIYKVSKLKISSDKSSKSLTWNSVSSKLRFFWLTISSTSESVEDDLLSGYRLQSSRVIRHAAHQPENNEKGVAKNNQVMEKNDFSVIETPKSFQK
jgi:hypothetical protein